MGKGRCVVKLTIQGLLTVSNFSYCIAISRRTQVAQIWGKPIYVITGVAIIPLASQAEAEQAIQQAKKSSARLDRKKTAKEPAESEDEDSDEDTVVSEERVSLDEDEPSSVPRTSLDVAETGEKREPGIVEDVITKKGGYGRFADRWFSRRGWNTDQTQKVVPPEERKDVSEESENGGEPEDQPLETHQSWPQAPTIQEDSKDKSNDSAQEHLTTSLIPKLVQTTKLLFNSRTFFFSYDLDISHSLGSQRRGTSEMALHKQFDQQVYICHSMRPPILLC